MITRSKIRQYVKSLAKTFKPERVILFGSYARGRPGDDSDVDLLVVMDHAQPRNIEQAINTRLRMDAPFPMDMLVRKPLDIGRRLAQGDSFLSGIMRDGKVLYDRTRQRMD